MSIGRSLRFRVLSRDGFQCRYCGGKAPDVVLHVDHIHPRAHGGTDVMENLITACFDCNMGKRDRVMEDDTAAIVAPKSKGTVARGVNWAMLEGKFIHVKGDDGLVHRQGRIVAFTDEYATIEWFDWLVGMGGTRTIEHFDELVKRGIYVYENDEAMRYAWDYGTVPRAWR